MAFCGRMIGHGSWDKGWSRSGPIVGSRPLKIGSSNDLLCYGEYTANEQRKPVGIYASTDWGITWERVAEFHGVRHIHGVFADPYESGTWWVSTGDENEESGIWISTDELRTFQKVFGGSQMSRAVDLIVRRDAVFFGSDSPLVRNYIQRLDRRTMNIDQLVAVGSSVFHGLEASGMWFSTAVEPSAVNRARTCELWYSATGEDWSIVAGFSKDRLPMRLFQYGQIMLPRDARSAGNLDGSIWVSPYATQGHGLSFRVSVPAGSPAEAGSPNG